MMSSKSLAVATYPTQGAQSIRRAAALLRIVAMSGDAGASLTEVAQVANLHKATVHRILKVLFEEGLLEFDEVSKQYRLGVEVYALSRSMGDKFDISAIAWDLMAKLSRDTGDTFYLAIRTGYDALCLSRSEGSYPEKTLTLNQGDRWPLGVGAFSVALLSFMPDSEIKPIIRHNAKRLAKNDQYSEELMWRQVAQTRKDGFAVTQNYVYPTMCAVGVPVLDPHGRPIASLCATAVLSRMDEARRKLIAGKLKKAARNIVANWSALHGASRSVESWQTPARGIRIITRSNI